MTAFQDAPNPEGHSTRAAFDGAPLPTAELPEVATSHGTQTPGPRDVDGVNGLKGPHNNDPFELSSQYAYKPRKVRVFTIGAGFSGLIMAHKFQHRFPALRDIVAHTIFEARSDVGGTWLANHYPGVQCDVPAHIYAFPFDPKPDWERFYASGEDILSYIKNTVRNWNLDRDLQLNTRVVGAHWQPDAGEWRVEVEHQGQRRVEYCDVLISAQGVLVHEAWPKIPGIENFKGHVTHSAAWDHSYDYSNKRIAVIGNGSSGIQIVPQMAKLPGTDVQNFIRGPAWVYYRAPPSKHLGRDDPDPNPKYTEEDKERFRDPTFHLQHRKQIISKTNKSFHIFMKGSNNQEGMKAAAAQMAEKLNHDPELCEKLIPKWELGCRRITPGPGYLESFLRPNCHLTDSPTAKVTEHAVHTADGKVFECDVLICATGFDVSHRPRFPIVGHHGVDLSQLWNEDPESYVSVAAPNIPNYFMMMGPNCLGGHGSLVESLNWTGDYFAKWIYKMATEDIRCIHPRMDKVKAFTRYTDQVHKTLVWSGGCKSWYKRNRIDGRVTALFGGSAHLFQRLLSEIRAEDFEIEYRTSNPFRFLGNGFTEFEMDPGSDLSWYVEKAEVIGDDTQQPMAGLSVPYGAQVNGL